MKAFTALALASVFATPLVMGKPIKNASGDFPEGYPEEVPGYGDGYATTTSSGYYKPSHTAPPQYSSTTSTSYQYSYTPSSSQYGVSTSSQQYGTSTSIVTVAAPMPPVMRTTTTTPLTTTNTTTSPGATIPTSPSQPPIKDVVSPLFAPAVYGDGKVHCKCDGGPSMGPRLGYILELPMDKKYNFQCGSGFLDNLHGRCGGDILNWHCHWDDIFAENATATVTFFAGEHCTMGDIWNVYKASSYGENLGWSCEGNGYPCHD